MQINESFYTAKHDDRLSQGSVLTDVVYRTEKITEEGVSFEEITLPFIVIMTQDCDLEQDNNERTGDGDQKDKHLTSIVGVPAFISDEVKRGEHFSAFNLKMREFSAKEWKYLEKNQYERYHHIKADDEFDLPSITLDFKHFYTFDCTKLSDYILESPESHLCRINYFYREDLSRRFSNYISRVAVPNELVPASTVAQEGD